MSKRFNLREFQQQVLDRLQAQGAGNAKISTLGVQVGQHLCLVDMTDISEVLPVPVMTQVPLTKPWYCGVANVRGNLYSIIDLNAFPDQPPTVREAANRVLLLGQRFAFSAGVLVSRVLGLRNTESWQRTEESGIVRYRDERGQIWHRLDIQQLLQQPEFLQIGE
ncbi:chemotaxis protein CheW [Ferrigenium sp. UT5]|uniref:chemotaxis protein CheW n=1 Tax=Ferrigenium sp. UT5 TaxID=3242105 RepID=UPI00354CE390